MRVERISYSGLTIVSKLDSKLIGNLLYIRNVEKITEINNKKITSLTIRKYHNMMELMVAIEIFTSYFYFHRITSVDGIIFLFFQESIYQVLLNENISLNDIGKKIIFHIDFDYFYAQCEEIRKPELRNIPSIVCVYSGREQDSGVVSTCNYEARKYGVKAAMPIRLAKSKLKDVEAIFLPTDMPYYQEISRNAMKIIQNYGELFEQVSVDECYMDFTKITNSDFDDARIFAASLQKNIKDQIKLTCSIGVGPNKLIAKIASGINKPDGITVVNQEDAKRFISNRKIEDIPGVGPKTSKKLESLGIESISDISKKSIFELRDSLGYKIATFLVNASNGIDYSQIKVRGTSKQIGKIVTLKKDIANFEQIKLTASNLCKSVYENLENKRQAFRVLTLILILENLQHVSFSKSLKLYSASFDELHKNSLSIIHEMISNNSISLDNIRRMGIVVSDLKDISGQDSLLNYFEN
jgi:DNA polymerase IV (archaeal DinB-like DNA polymerase)